MSGQAAQVAQTNHSISHSLREATHELHRRAEAALPLMDGRLTLASYTAHVRALWPTVWATERALGPWQSQLSQLWGHNEALRPRAHYLHTDAQALLGQQLPQDPSPQTASIFALPTLAHAVGGWYVLGGSRLGGQVILRRLRKILGLDDRTGLAYYGSCTPRDGTLFRQFARTIDRGRLAVHKDDVLHGAVVTFTWWCVTLQGSSASHRPT